MNGFDDFDTQLQSDEFSSEYLADSEYLDDISPREFLEGHVWDEGESEHEPMYPFDHFEGFADFWEDP
jgi:hypothetical protein